MQTRKKFFNILFLIIFITTVTPLSDNEKMPEPFKWEEKL